MLLEMNDVLGVRESELVRTNPLVYRMPGHKRTQSVNLLHVEHKWHTRLTEAEYLREKLIHIFVYQLTFPSSLYLWQKYLNIYCSGIRTAERWPIINSLQQSSQWIRGKTTRQSELMAHMWPICMFLTSLPPISGLYSSTWQAVLFHRPPLRCISMKNY